MSDSPFFQFYPSDWLAGTRGLTAAETGIYITLVAMMYEANGPVPADMKRLSRLCGSTATAFKKCIDGLIETGKLTLDERGFFNHRVGIEIEKRNKKRSSASENANSRWGKTKEKQSPSDAGASNPQCETDAIQNPESRVQIRKKETSDDVSKESPPLRGCRLPPGWSPSQNDTDWAKREFPLIDLNLETEKFRNHWLAKTGKDATKLDWSRTWRNWVMNAKPPYRPKPRPSSGHGYGGFVPMHPGAGG